MRRLAISVAVLAAVAMLAGCGGDSADNDARAAAVPRSDATMVGTITSVDAFTPITEDCVPAEDVHPDAVASSDDPPVCTDPAHAPQGSILVEVEPGATSGDKISFTISQQTKLLSKMDAKIDFRDLTEGDRVRVGYSGPVAASYPGQATADSVVVGGAAS